MDVLCFVLWKLEQMPRPRASSANTSQNSSACEKDADVIRNGLTSNAAGSSATSQKPLFTSSTKAIVWGKTNTQY